VPLPAIVVIIIVFWFDSDDILRTVEDSEIADFVSGKDESFLGGWVKIDSVLLRLGDQAGNI
jgi:hypothetical protein